MTTLMPTTFFGHGNPMNALSRNVYTDDWASIGKSIPRPRAVLAVSAHWYIPACAVTANPAPRTIHDFGGFLRELYEVTYPAPGSPELARQVKDLLSPAAARFDETWGLDHGTWTVLTHVFPKADIPVVQLSIDERQPPMFHYQMGKRLATLREEGVLVIGSGNIVHNLHTYAWGDRRIQTFDWAVRFEQKGQDFILEGDDAQVVFYQNLGRDAMLAVPTPDHYLPLLYMLGLRKENEQISFPVPGVDGGSISMLAVQMG
ncbi:MAG TPA: 4,5-DOPA dioxygenase extradiol [Nitrospiraceae bacterium]|nr:4,5-DOPA dioxygenase extradiol [Nitrospiraceae bacterium]